MVENGFHWGEKKTHRKKKWWSYFLLWVHLVCVHVTDSGTISAFRPQEVSSMCFSGMQIDGTQRGFSPKRKESFDWWFSKIFNIVIWREHFWNCGLSEFILEDEKTIPIEFNPGKFGSFISHKSTQKSRDKEKMKTLLFRQFFLLLNSEAHKKKHVNFTSSFQVW